MSSSEISVLYEDTEEVQEITRSINFECKPLEKKPDKLFSIILLLSYFIELRRYTNLLDLDHQSGAFSVRVIIWFIQLD